ncbi:MAG: glycosyltransferase family 39 protein [Elusimicrobia bacterium]|nr:glycosyltransferase family 39 protein [Elusimicrobiota bacterium]
MMNIKEIPNYLVAFLLSVWALFIGWSFYHPSDFISFADTAAQLPVLAGIFAHPWLLGGYSFSLLTCLLMLVAATAVGSFVLRRFVKPFPEGAEMLLAGTGLGLALFSYLGLYLGLAGLLHVWVSRLLLYPAGIVGIIYLVQNNHPSLRFKLPAGLVARASIVLMVLAALANLVGVLAPEIYYDTLVYHLALPAQYNLAGRIIEIPSHGFSYFPQNMEMLYSLILLAGNDLTARLVHYFFGLGCCLLIYLLGRRWFSRTVGTLASAVFYFIPLVAMESWTAVNDLALTFYVLLNLLFISLWLEEEKRSDFYLAAFFCGFSLGIKYVTFPALAANLALIGIYYYRQKQPGKIIPGLAKFAAVVLLLVSPWLVKNTLTAGTPLAPFIHSPMSGKGPDFRLDKYARECERPQSFSLENLVVKPLNAVLDETSQDSFIGPFFLAFLPLFILSLIYARRAGIRWHLPVYFSIYLLLWRSQTSIWRFLLPILPLFCILIIAFVYNGQMNRWTKWSMKLIVLLVLVTNFGMILSSLNRKEPYQVVAGDEKVDDYLSRSHPFYPYPVYPAITFFNNSLPISSKVMFVGEERGYYSRRQLIVNSAFDQPTFQKYYENVPDADTLAARLIAADIRYILFNEGELLRMQISYRPFRFSRGDLKLLREFWSNNSRMLYYKDGVGVYQIIEKRIKPPK